MVADGHWALRYSIRAPDAAVGNHTALLVCLWRDWQRAVGGPPGCAAVQRAAVAGGSWSPLQYSFRAVVSNDRFWRRDGSAAREGGVLAAVGPPGSAAVLAALAHGDYGDHGLLRLVSRGLLLGAVAPVLRAYGESLRLTVAWSARLLQQACFCGHVAAASALLGVHRRSGCINEALAHSEHAALRYSACHPDVLALLLAEYGEPGGDPLLAALAVGDHTALRWACARSVALLAAAYGPPGCAAVRTAVADARVLKGFFYAHARVRDARTRRSARRDRGCHGLRAARGALCRGPARAAGCLRSAGLRCCAVRVGRRRLAAGRRPAADSDADPWGGAGASD